MEIDRAHGRRQELWGNEGRWLLDRHGHRWKDNAVLDIRETVSA